MKPPEQPWDRAVLLLESFLSQPGRKADELLERLPGSLEREDRRRCQHLFLGAIRHGLHIRAALAPLVRSAPRPRLEALLMVAGYELLEAAPEKKPQVIHHAVERAKGLGSAPEARFANAVLRRLGTALEAAPDTEAARLSHPGWLVERWTAAFGTADTRRLLEWNQQIPVNHAYLPDNDGEAAPETAGSWTGFHRLETPDARSELATALADGGAYIRDPSTRLAPDLLRARPDETVLDLCAAPGGKTFALAHAMEGRGRLVALDLPGRRQRRLEENAAALRRRFDALDLAIHAADLLETTPDSLAAAGLPPTFDAVLLDAPCTNTGVIQRRPDVIWRLSPSSIDKASGLQARLLSAAARLVGPGGRLVYSTCSLEAEENRAIVDAFLASDDGKAFDLVEAVESRPWQSGHDGAGAYLLAR